MNTSKESAEHTKATSILDCNLQELMMHVALADLYWGELGWPVQPGLGLQVLPHSSPARFRALDGRRRRSGCWKTEVEDDPSNWGLFVTSSGPLAQPNCLKLGPSANTTGSSQQTQEPASRSCKPHRPRRRNPTPRRAAAAASASRQGVVAAHGGGGGGGGRDCAGHCPGWARGDRGAGGSRGVGAAPGAVVAGAALVGVGRGRGSACKKTIASSKKTKKKTRCLYPLLNA